MTSRILTAGLVAGILAAAGLRPGAQPASRAPRNAAEVTGGTGFPLNAIAMF